ncbi:hypothetical protein Shyhy01_01750 [Streptomyces hygroscopicus subsp. hygroscopicus]|nr:hypothetical protein Shyhy01_01750 [Streptomyces hygroscopicus subsp. hygroscopicus]
MGPHVARPTARAVATVGAAGTDRGVTEQPAARTPAASPAGWAATTVTTFPTPGSAVVVGTPGPATAAKAPSAVPVPATCGVAATATAAARPGCSARSAPARRLERPGVHGSGVSSVMTAPLVRRAPKRRGGGPEPTAVPGTDRATGACAGGRAPLREPARPAGPAGSGGRRPTGPGRSGAPPANAPVAAASALADRVHERAAGSAGRSTAGECAPARGPLNPA